jgi:putative ABC transport system permease protein
MQLGRRNLLQDKTRLGLSILGVALAVTLMLVLNGFLNGMYRQVAAYLDHAPGSVIVAQDGVSNLLGATSVLPPGTADAVRKTDGVAQVVPILSQFVILDIHGRKQPTYLIGYEPALGGGPWQLAAGRAPRTDDEVVFDRVLAQRQAIALGDNLDVMGRQFAVVGLSDGTTSWMTSFFFMRKSAVESLLRAPGATSFLLVTPSDGVSADALRDRLGGLRGTNALLKREMAANDTRLLVRYFSAPLQLMVGIAFLVGALVVGLIIYTATVERQREYGVLKAIGARNRLLYQVVVAQALIAAGVGAVGGVVAAYGAAQLVMALHPQYLVALEPLTVAQVLLAGLVMALAAALVPARLVARLAPADAFRR